MGGGHRLNIWGLGTARHAVLSTQTRFLGAGEAGRHELMHACEGEDVGAHDLRGVGHRAYQ